MKVFFAENYKSTNPVSKVYEKQKEMREEIKKYISDCNVFNLHKIYDEMKRLQDR